MYTPFYLGLSNTVLLNWVYINVNQKINATKNVNVGPYDFPYSYTTTCCFAVATHEAIARIVANTLSEFTLNMYNAYNSSNVTATDVYINIIGY